MGYHDDGGGSRPAAIVLSITQQVKSTGQPSRGARWAASGPSEDPGRLAGLGFTMIELLTVIAIIAVLATLLLTALASAQKKSRQARCSSNLHQVSLALAMYLDDSDRRPQQLYHLVRTRYLPSPPSLLCPQDPTGNWGGLVNMGLSGIFTPPGGEDRTSQPAEAPMPYSYLHPLSWDDSAWQRLVKLGSFMGIATCQLHGLGRPRSPAPSARDFDGLILRAQRDGAVVRRKVFWSDADKWLPGATQGAGDFTGGPAGAELDYPWPLFSDEIPPQ